MWPESGDQPSLQRARLEGITYDPDTKLLEFACETGDHRVAPEQVWVAEAPDGFPRSIEVVRRDGAREIATIERVALERAD